MNRPCPGPAGGVLEAAQRRRAGQPTIPLHRRLQGKVVAKRPVAGDVLMAERNPINTLAQHRRKTVFDLAPLAPVNQPPRHRGRQSRQPIRLAQKQNTPVRCDGAARKIRLNTTLATGWKLQTRKGTIRHRQFLPFDPF